MILKLLTGGKKFEDIAFNIYGTLTNKKLFKLGLLTHDKFCWLGASPDGITEDAKLLEIKCVYNRKIGGKEPYYYWIQVQIQMEVTNTEECDLFQCKFIEYESKREYLKDKLTPKIFKGYSEYEDKKFYWKLEKFTCNTIKRDKVWFNNHISIMNQFYRDILYYRENGLPSKKRKSKNNEIEPVSKRTRANSLRDYLKHDWNKWVAATDVKNYIMDDPIIDWYNLYGGRFNLLSDKNIKTKFNFNEFILNRGVEFEAAIILNIEKRFGSSIVKIANIYEGYSIKKYKQTINEMKKGTPIISSGILHNYINNTYGIPDLIVRSDYINKIFQEDILTKEEESKKCLFSDKWHYRIIDIKFTTINFDKKNNYIKNTGNIKAYKSQVIIYNSALGIIQNYEPDICFILGRKIKKDNKKYNSFYTLGPVNIHKKDKYLLNKIKEGISWIKKLKKNGHKWNPEEMKIKELFPNMTNKNDYPWHYEKKKLAIKIKELTQIWKIGIKERKKLHKNGILSWDSIMFSSKLLNYNDNTKLLIDNIISINKNNNIICNKFESNKLESNNVKEFYVDFETTSDLNESFNDVINYDNEDNLEIKNNVDNLIYMIGIGWIENSRWKFKNLLVNRLNYYEEKFIIKQFLEIINSNKNCKVYHWSNAEPILLNKALIRNNIKVKINWIDLLKIFKSIPISIKGNFSFGLKNISRTMFKYGLINTNWKDSNIDGLDAMLVAWIAENECSKNNINSIKDFYEMKEIIDYNEIDCKTMWDILKYIRKPISNVRVI